MWTAPNLDPTRVLALPPLLTLSHVGWTKEETIESLLKKAGTKGQFTQALKDSIKLTRYRSEKVKMTFEVFTLLTIKVLT